MKKLVSIVATFVLMLVFVSPQQFSASETHSHLENFSPLSEIGVRYVPCPEGGKHAMYGRGSGEVRDASGNRLLKGNTTQCSKCGDVIISQFNPNDYRTTYLGYYGYQNSMDTVNQYTIMYTNKLYYNSDLVSDPFFDSFVFY